MPAADITVADISVSGLTGSLVGSGHVDIEADAARVAVFEWRPAGTAPTCTPASLRGQPISISAGGTTIFAGRIQGVGWDPVRRVLQVTAADGLQAVCNGLSQAELLSTLGGTYLETLFGPRRSGWDQARDILSTVGRSMYLTTQGALTTFAWSDGGGSALPALYGSVDADYADASQISNLITCTAKVRYTRRYHREIDWSWHYGHASWCDWYVSPHSLPTRDMVEQAQAGSGWLLSGGIAYTGHPPTGEYQCAGPVGWIIDEELRAQVVLTASWSACKRWTQTVTETWVLTVSATGSQGIWGVLPDEDAADYQEAYDDVGWDVSTGTDQPSGDGWQTADATTWRDELDRAAADAHLLALVQTAWIAIWGSHRQSRVSADVVMSPGLALGASRSVAAHGVSAAGQITRLVHRWDCDSGSAITRATLTVTDPGLATQAPSFGLPDPPDTAPAPAGQTQIALPTAIGGETGSPVDPGGAGYFGNASSPDSGAEVYAERFVVIGPEIETESRDELIPAEAAAEVYSV